MLKSWCPGDIIRLRLGDIIPADVKLFDGEYLSVDQSALTGESLPVNKRTGDIAYSGSIAKQGEMVGLVTGEPAATPISVRPPNSSPVPNPFLISRRRYCKSATT